ncbi:hypothetical protein CPB97_000371 [Podila verticillata]|nr:hypothetical protein CPB97_000371 [Podila verticillata]
MSFNRNIPLVIAAGVGIMSGFYIWEPMFKKYQRESKGTWQYEVVQQTREEERNRVADAAASSLSNNASTPSPSTVSTPSTAPASSSPSATPSPEASPSAA